MGAQEKVIAHAGQIAVHLTKRCVTQVDQNSNPIVEAVDAIFTLDAGLITSVNVTLIYSTDKTLWAMWGNFGPKTQALMT